MSYIDVFQWNFHSLCSFWWRISRNKNKKFWVTGGPDGYLWPLGPVGQLLVQKYVIFYQSNIFFEKLLYKPIRKKTKWVTFEKKFLSFFCKGPPLSKKLTKIFFYPDITIHTPIESPSRVYSKYVVFKNIYFDFWPKKAYKQCKKVFFNVVESRNAISQNASRRKGLETHFHQVSDRSYTELCPWEYKVSFYGILL